MSIRFIWSRVQFSSAVSLLIFCIDGLSIAESEVFKSPNVTVLESFSPFRSVNICFICLGAVFRIAIYSSLSLYNNHIYLIQVYLFLLSFGFNLYGMSYSSPSFSVCVSLEMKFHISNILLGLIFF